jgi:glucose-6-phosphate 1-dehydrogenase
LPVDASDSASYEKLRGRLGELDQEASVPGNHLFYLSVSPALYGDIIGQLGAAGLAAEEKGAWVRVIIEKPFGRDLESARALTQQVQSAFREEQVFRIDHYLGKETVQNLVVFRFANAIYEPLWNRNHIDHVQITVAESLGVEERAGYYDQSGALRDMIQNHLLQVMCLVAMEPPSEFAAAAVRREKLKVMQSIRPMLPREVAHNAVRGQYGAGKLGGKKVAGYREANGVQDDSATETFAALRLEVNDWRWAGVPFYLRTGKSMAEKRSEITIQFREAPLQLFACTALQPCEPNLLTIRIQPDEGIGLRSIVKTPGLDVIGHSVQLDFAYSEAFEGSAPTAYETLLLDALEGDNMLFASGDWVDRAWELVMPVLESWEGDIPKDFPNYEAGSWGPRDADALLERDGRKWHVE